MSGAARTAPIEEQVPGTRAAGSPPVRARVVVIGAGLTGLAAAWHLRDELDVTVLEAAERVGGEVLTVPFADTQMDVGADAFLARQPEAEALARAAGFGDDDLVAPATGQVHLWVRGRLRPLPSGTVLGAPTDLRALARSGVLSPSGLARAALEPLLPRRRIVGDRSVADLVGERFGQQVVDHLVEPLLGGVYAGLADRLSAQAAAAPIWAASTKHRSLLVALMRHRRAAQSDARPVFLTLRGGLGRLTEVLANDLGDRVRTGAGATGIVRDGDRWCVTDATGTEHVADTVIMAVPARASAALVGSLSSDAARELSGIGAASVGVVAMAYRREDARRVPTGSGILIPRTEGRLVKAVTFASRKWPHHAQHDRFLLRASVGRIDDVRALELGDEELIERVDTEVRQMTCLAAPAVAATVQRWPDALPQHDVGHHARVDRLRAALRRDAPGLHLGGASLDGVGLAARARDAERLAHEARWEAGLVPSAQR